MPWGVDPLELCGFGEELPDYIVARWETNHRITPEGTFKLQLTMDDLPKLAKAFGLEWEVRRSPADGSTSLHWKCRICGDLGSLLKCDPEKHTEHWNEIERADRAREGVRR